MHVQMDGHSTIELWTKSTKISTNCPIIVIKTTSGVFVYDSISGQLCAVGLISKRWFLYYHYIIRVLVSFLTKQLNY